MPTEVRATPRAEQQIGRLSRKHSTAFERFLNELAAAGCRALAYRLSGQGLPLGTREELAPFVGSKMQHRTIRVLAITYSDAV